MLQRIREGAQGWIAWTILILITLAFVLWGLQYYINHGRAIQPIAKVNGETIFKSQWEKSYVRAKRQQLISLERAALSVTEEKQLKAAVLQQMIREYITSTVGAVDGFRIGDSQVQRTMMSIPGLQVDGKFSDRVWQRLLNQLQLTPQQFMDEIRYDILQNQIQSGFTLSSFVLSNEIDRAVELLQQQRDIVYIVFPKSRYQMDGKPSEKELHAFYKKYSKRWLMPEQVKLEYITLTPDIFLKNHKVNEKDIKAYYEKNKVQYRYSDEWQLAHILIKVSENADAATKAKAKQHAGEVLEKLKQGANFAQLAAQYSEDVLSKNRGGDLGWVRRETLDKILQKAVNSLKPGQFSEPVLSKYGYGIIKLTAVKPGKIRSFDEVKDEIKQALTTRQLDQWFAEKSEELSDLVYANPDTLSVASEQLGLEIKETGFIHRNLQNYSGIARNKQVREAAFSSEVLNDGYNSAPIEMGPQSLVVLRVKRHVKERVPNYNEVKSRLMEFYREKQARANVLAAANEQMLKFSKGKPMSELAEQLNLKMKEQRGITRYQQQGISKELRNAVFALPRPLKNRSVAHNVLLKNGDVALVALQSITRGALLPKDHEAQKNVLREELANRFGMMDYNFYVRDLMNQANIKILVAPADLTVQQ